jgi:hypothetical protein
MGKKKSKPKPAPPPPPPKPANSYNYQDGKLVSSSVFDAGKNAYINTTYQDPADTAAKAKLQEQYNTMISQLGKTSPERAAQLQEYEKSFYQRAIRPLEDEYKRGQNQAREDFNASGFLNSTGYEDYRANNLDKIYHQGLTQAAQDAIMAREQLAAQDDAQLLQRAGFVASGLDSNAANQIRLADFARLGSANLNQYASDNYRNQLEALRLERASQQQQASTSPFWRRFLFGF